MAKYAGSYHALSTFSFERLSSILLGSQPTQLKSQAFARIYDRKYPEYSKKRLEPMMNAINEEQVELYAFLQQALTSKKFFIIAKRKVSDLSSMPAVINAKMVRAVDHVFQPDYHFLLK